MSRDSSIRCRCEPPEEQGFESLAAYTRGGFHPIIIGDMLPKHGTCLDLTKEPRYRIYQKLGFGAFGMVWLAWDMLVERWVAVKVCNGTAELASDGTASECTSSETELAKLRQMATVCNEHEGHKYIIEMYDTFTIHGPNGYHECLVTVVILPLSGLQWFPEFDAQRAAGQILAGFAYLHQQGLAHGDPTKHSLGVAVPPLNQLTDEEVEERFDAINETFEDTRWRPVMAVDTDYPEGSVPAYLTETFPLAKFLAYRGLLPSSQTFEIRIFDFGRAFWTDQGVDELPGCCHFDYEPPEVQIHSMSHGKVGTPWSKEADIWAVACLLTALQISGLNGQSLMNLDDWDDRRLFKCCQLGGEPPQEWLKYWDLEGLRVTTQGVDKDPLPHYWNRDEAWESLKFGDVQNRDALVDLLRAMVRTEPKERTPLHSLLDHPYITGLSGVGDLHDGQIKASGCKGVADVYQLG
ncbi:serine/threonine protein kinase [Coniochaeta ligniaria NRRL 30616]|uniref:non-specific serine/threonine protein kinase n=1 Tax=Coniochaeta ligniaria NRRL 30616 TaxID=1408157 RepID=A0A1J7I6U0_9PEZI|nr:serine/threonine protein kinase [Coniochaeta ligniaria NRRL 30616]